MSLLLNNWPILCAGFFSPDSILLKRARRNGRHGNSVHNSIRIFMVWMNSCVHNFKRGQSINCSRQRAHLSDSLFIFFALLERHYHFSISCALNFIWMWFYFYQFRVKRPHIKQLWISIAILWQMPRGINSLYWPCSRPSQNSLDRQFSNKCYNFMIRTKLDINLLYSAWMHFLMPILEPCGL